MKRPLPLTACPAPSLDWSRPGVPAATAFEDIYFSTDGGLEESQAVFLKGCDLPNRWRNRLHSTIGELGFGSGLNFLSTWQSWDQSETGGHLHYVSVEKYPFSREELKHALHHWPELGPKTQSLIAQWPGRVKGLHRLRLAPDVTLTLIHDDIVPALNALDARIDSWFLDGFSPAKNPEMWSQDVMDALARLSHKENRLASFSVAGQVRQALAKAGFDVEKKPGFGRKRHRLEAKYAGKTPSSVALRNDQTHISPIIIGGGIAGASLAYALQRYGLSPILYEKDPQYLQAASGNPAALIKPRLDLQDRAESRFFLASFLYACEIFAQCNAITTRSIIHKSLSAKDTERFKKLVGQAALSSDHMTLSGNDLNLISSCVINPKTAITYLTRNIEIRTANITRYEKIDKTWNVFDSHNTCIGQGSHIILCAGADIRHFAKENDEPFRFSRGQLSWAKADKRLTRPVTYGGYALPLEDNILLGATHDRLGYKNPYLVNQKSDEYNFSAFRQTMGYDLKPSSRPSRASIRVTTANTLPRAGQTAEGIWILSGLGSRGFVFAPLLGDFIAAQILGLPSPLDRRLKQIFAPRTIKV